MLRDFKINQLKNILTKAVDFKYSVSLAKGTRIFFETMIMFAFMFCLVIKANVFSLVYLIFVIKYMTSSLGTGETNRMPLLAKMNKYVCICLFIQYMLILMNLTSLTTPAKFPEAFRDYPKN